MFKYLVLLERRAGTEHDGFVNFIENEYLSHQLACLPYVKTRRSNFLRAGGGVVAALIADIPPGPPYHVILENWLAEGDLERLRRDLNDPRTQRRLREAGGDWLRPGGARAVAVEERETAPHELGSARGATDDGSMIKQIANMKALPEMTYPEFVSYYETQHATMAARLVPTFAKYVRNFVLPDPALQADLNPGKSWRADFDVMTQMWFQDATAYKEFGQSFGRAEIARAFAEDEAKLFDRKSIQLFNVEEHVR